MGSRLSYKGDQMDYGIIEFCQELILCCIPEFEHKNFKTQKDISDYFDGLSDEKINAAFSSKKMEYKLILEILQHCNIAYNEPTLLIFIQSLLHDKTFYALNKKGNTKRILTKRLIDKALKNHLLKVVPKELAFLIKNQYFIKYINEFFLPLEKNRIIITIEKFFDLSQCEKNSLYSKLNINYEEYEKARNIINTFRNKYKNTLEKYKSDPEYQTIEQTQSLHNKIKKCKTMIKDGKSLDDTTDELFIN